MKLSCLNRKYKHLKILAPQGILHLKLIHFVIFLGKSTLVHHFKLMYHHLQKPLTLLCMINIELQSVGFHLSMRRENGSKKVSVVTFP